MAGRTRTPIGSMPICSAAHPTREAGKGSASVRRLSLSLIYSAVGVWKRQSAVSPKASRSGTRYSSGAALGARKDPSVVDGVGLPRAGELATAPPLQIGHLAQRLPPASGKWLGVPGLNFLDAERGGLAPSPTGLSPSCANNPRSYLRWPTLAVLRVRGPRGRRVSPGRGEPGRVDRKRVGKGLGAD